MSNAVIEYKSTIEVDGVRILASDDMVASAARVSTLGSEVSESTENPEGLIHFLMRNRHGSPFEHNYFTFRVTAPIFVWREHMRHRIGFSYNEESGRYKQLDPVFYIPDENRSMVQVGVPGKYHFVTSEHQSALAIASIRAISAAAYHEYERLLEEGVAREVARMLLPLNIFSTAYVTMNARSLMNFLSLRTTNEESFFPSYPQREIEMVAEQYEIAFSVAMPSTYQAFCEYGRVAP